MLKETNAGCVSNDLVAIDANAHGMLPLVFGLFSLFTLIVSVRFNWEILLLAPPLVWFLVVPLCDKYGRDDEFNHCALVSAHDAHYEVTLVALLSLFGLLLVGTTDSSSLLTMFALGITGGLLVTVAWHGVQYCDDESTTGNFMKRMLCAVTLIPHLGVDSRDGHAADASTPKDVASARMGESYYRYVYRYFSGAILRGWRGENSRVSNESTEKAYKILHNEMIQILSMSVFYVTAAWIFGGIGLVVLVLTQALVAAWQLTAIEYVEHYGMLRNRFPDGGYSSLGHEQIWCTGGAVNNSLLSERQFHNHCPSQLDPTISKTSEQPRLPIGFNLLSLLVLLPSYWFNFLHEKLAILVDYDLTRVNLDGQAYVALMERFHKPGQ
jgi:alkane 1-monooxygenase